VPDPPDREFIAALPKCELHLHLEGSLRPDTMFALAQRHGIELQRSDLEQRYDFSNFDDFLQLFLLGLRVLRTGEDFTDAIVALGRELGEQNVRYAEVTTTAFSHHRRGLAMSEYAAGLNAGRRIARERYGVDFGWVIDIPREIEGPDSRFTLDYVTGPNAPDGIVGMGLGGPEPGNPPEPYAPLFAEARAAGLRSLPHAGETEGAASVRGAVEQLGAERIGHGVNAIHDDEVVELLLERDVHLEVSVSSNVALKVVPDVESHPLPRLLAAGLDVGLNTDDPAYFSTTLNDELELVANTFALTRKDLVDLQRAAFRASTLPEDRRRTELAALDAIPV